MRENTNEKGLVVVNKNSLVYKIQYFLKGIFSGNNKGILTRAPKVNKANIIIPTEINVKAAIIKENVADYFIKCMKSIEEDETRLQRIQEKYHTGNIEGEITVEQIDDLCNLYKKQIDNLEKLKEMKQKEGVED